MAIRQQGGSGWGLIQATDPESSRQESSPHPFPQIYYLFFSRDKPKGRQAG